MVLHEPVGDGRRALACARYGGVVAVWLLAVVACGRSEIDVVDDSEYGSVAGSAGRGGNSGVAGASSHGGGNSVTGGANGTGVSGGFGTSGATAHGGFSSVAGGFGTSGATGRAGNSGVSGGFGTSGATGQAGNNGASGSTSSGENCTNGIDDDHDGAADCADTDCVAGFMCAPPTPGGGWVGPLSFWSGSGSPPACTNESGFPTEVANASSGLSVAPSSCYSCECGSPQGVSCQVGALTIFSGDACFGVNRTLNIVQGECVAFLSQTMDPASVRWENAPPAGGACIPKTSGSAVIPPVQWDNRMRACGDAPPNGAGCGIGSCVARPKAPFAKQFCVYQRGDLACPAGSYSDRSVYFGGVNDTRTCTDCGCTPPFGTSCTGTLKMFTDIFCGVDETNLSSVSECSALAPDPTPPDLPYLTLRSALYNGSPGSDGSCATQSSRAEGGVWESDPITVCCTP